MTLLHSLSHHHNVNLGQSRCFTCCTLYICMNGRNWATKPGAQSPKYTSWGKEREKDAATTTESCKKPYLVQNHREPDGYGEAWVIVSHVVPRIRQVRLRWIPQSRVGHCLQQRVQSRRRRRRHVSSYCTPHYDRESVVPRP